MSTPGHARELLSRAEKMLPDWYRWAPDDHRPAEALRAAHEALEHPSEETAAAVRAAARVAYATSGHALTIANDASDAAKAAAYDAAQAAATYAASVAPSSEPPTASTTPAHQTTPQAT